MVAAGGSREDHRARGRVHLEAGGRPPVQHLHGRSAIHPRALQRHRRPGEGAASAARGAGRWGSEAPSWWARPGCRGGSVAQRQRCTPVCFGLFCSLLALGSSCAAAERRRCRHRGRRCGRFGRRVGGSAGLSGSGRHRERAALCSCCCRFCRCTEQASREKGHGSGRSPVQVLDGEKRRGAQAMRQDRSRLFLLPDACQGRREAAISG
mmetsp:Transcript_72605/g.208435  ORF Transcript_72605/g.208435 Transcript_72605/m.208435 type:complete len:209 (-) Transcript_72605:184-810(-)